MLNTSCVMVQWHSGSSVFYRAMNARCLMHSFTTFSITGKMFTAQDWNWPYHQVLFVHTVELLSTKYKQKRHALYLAIGMQRHFKAWKKSRWGGRKGGREGERERPVIADNKLLQSIWASHKESNMCTHISLYIKQVSGSA